MIKRVVTLLSGTGGFHQSSNGAEEPAWPQRARGARRLRHFFLPSFLSGLPIQAGWEWPLRHDDKAAEVVALSRHRREAARRGLVLWPRSPRSKTQRDLLTLKQNSCITVAPLPRSRAPLPPVQGQGLWGGALLTSRDVAVQSFRHV